MQITLNTNEVSEVVLAYVKDQLCLDDSNTLVVELHEDGITVLVNEDSTGAANQPAGDKPARKPRQPRKPKADATPEVGKSVETPTTPAATTTVETAPASEPVTVEAAGDSNQNEVQSPGTKEPEVDPSNAVATTVAVVETAVDPELAAELAAASVEEDAAADAEAEPVKEAQAEEEPPRKPTQSLFANLRKPNNG